MEYILENNVLKLTVSSAGAEMVSLVRKDDGVEHIWGGGPLWNRHAPILFPYTGKVRGGSFTAKGQVFEGAQHGFARDMEHCLVSIGADELVLELRASEDTYKYWPYDFRLISSYRIDGDTLYHSMTVENPGEEKLMFGMGYHPAFRVPFDDVHTYADYEFRFEQEESPLCLQTSGGLIAGRVYALGSNIREIPLDEHFFDNDSHCMVNLRSRTLGIYEKDSGRAVVCGIDGFPYILIWSKPGEPQFVCIEPWHSIPDTIEASGKWEEKPAAAVLAPGEHFTATLKMRFAR